MYVVDCAISWDLKRISVGYSGDAYSLPIVKGVIGDVRWVRLVRMLIMGGGLCD